ncbi:P-loop containing nucleoside triphosphate hydrolase protein [Elsinoe ampelina]|uniref:P-loop containing nucleoside triphosphate hydrolase protein n=1 Tax=Elsinoe ampelina TaxID=302913 RepID=A0A6A6GEG6_9PEZI|nr:P-loop containing nucleoside triphosphate hydrolase protein [Elsinoe ampelina]
MTSRSCLSAADGVFGPSVDGCRDGFDFTLSFERYLFNLVPSVLFIVAAVPRVWYLARKERCISHSRSEYTKLATIIALGVTQLALLVLWSRDRGLTAWEQSVAAYSLSLFTCIVMVPLSYLEQARSLRPSVLLNAYLLVTVILDAAVVRTLWLLDSIPKSITGMQTAALACKIAILISESQHKRNRLVKSVNEKSPEDFSGLYSQSLFWWLNRIMWQGAKMVLSPTDLYPISSDIAAKQLSDRFEEYAVTVAAKGRQIHLISAIISLLRWPIVLAVLPRIALLGLTLCQPLLLRRLLSYLQAGALNRDANTGYGLIGAYGVVYVGIALVSALYWHRQFRFLTMMRGILTTAIYKKALDLDINAEDRAASVTLMSTDVQRIIRGFLDIHDMWANIIQVGVASYLIETQLGTAFVGPLAVAIVAVGASLVLARFVTFFQMQWIGKIQERITFITSALGSMKSIKIGGLENIVTQLLHNARKAELDAAGKFRLLSAVAVCIAQMPMLLSPVITFAIYLGLPESRDTGADVVKLFTSLSLIVLMAEPLFGLLESVMDIVSAFACIARIETFLQKTSRHGFGSPVMNSLGDRKYAPVDESQVIDVRNATFTWEGSSSPTLHNITASIPSRDLTMVVGPVASGKSTLLKAFLGEVRKTTGEMTVHASGLSWCEQTPWLQNQSIKSNICTFADFDSEWYHAVVNACDLQRDFDGLTNGDETMIGSKGTALSGGQKQRIALARAVYARRQLNILDDVLSQLDAATQKLVFSRLLSEGGLLRRGDTSVILATHAAVHLLPNADHVIVLSSSGTVLGQGTYTNLQQAGILDHSDFHNSAPSPDGIDSTNSVTKDTPASTDAVKAPDSAQKITSDQRRLTGDMSIYKYYFSKLDNSIVIIFLILQIAYAFFSTFPYIWLKWWTDTNQQQEARNSNFYIGIYAALQMAGLLFAGATTIWSFNVMAVSTGTALHDILAKTVISASFPVLGRIDTGAILTRFSQDIQLIDISLPLALQVVVGNTLICLGQMGLIASASAYIAICYPPLFIIFYYVQKYYLRTSRQMRLLDLEEKAPIYTQFTETIEGLATIRAFNGNVAAIQKNHELVDKAQKPFYLMYAIQRWLALVLDLIVAALAVIIVGVAVGLRDAASPGLTGVSLTQIISFTSALKLLIMFWTQLETSIGAVTRVREFEADTPTEHKADEMAEPPETWPEKGTLEMQGIRAQYKAGSQDWALQDIDISIEQGQKVALCGRTGSGKSTMALTWSRLLDEADGSIYIDGLDLSTINRTVLRSRLTYIADDPFILPGSVRDNIDIFQVAEDETITLTLKKTLLLDVVTSAGGLDAPMSSLILSQGQKQLLNFSRALLKKNGKLILLDEATSSVDQETDKIIQKLIRTEFKDHTVIAIAHRLDTILDFDFVGVMDSGRLVEYGKPSDLLQQQSRFRALRDSA